VFVEFSYYFDAAEYDERKQWDYATIQWLFDGERIDTNGPFISQDIVDRLIESSVAECRVRYMGGRTEDLTFPTEFLGELAKAVEGMSSGQAGEVP
jgi:hypothetical protein